ncbi:choice-of-anchor D domain-containing protein [Melioribacteraceae bacterium 4301-Me]|uniref:choice-of-anchor D domain-containing protein n=1 Tax=Pyranulibacter aquaticus TaxID=3163344 RepID=UPI003599B065
MKCLRLFLVFLLLINFFAALCYSQSALVINEILADPPSDSTGDANGDGAADLHKDEFVELVNAGSIALDISGWTLSDSTALRHIFPTGTILLPGRAIVVFGGGTPTGTFGGAIIQTASTGSLLLNNSNEAVIIKNSLGTVVARYTYGSEGNYDQSLARNPDITGAFVKHTEILGGGSKFSPGVGNVTGQPFLPEIDIKGNGIAILNGDSSPRINNNTDFGNVNIVTDAIEKEFVIENTGLALLSLTGTSPYITITGDSLDFTVTQIPFQTILSRDSTIFKITFNPTALGTRSATISIANDDNDENPYSFAIKGEGYKTIPSLYNIENLPLEYTEREGGRQITNSIMLNDLYNIPQASAIIKITENYVSGEDKLLFTNQNGISGTWDELTGTLYLTGNASQADYQTALRSVEYQNTSDSPTIAQRIVSFTINDGIDNSNTVTRTINITSVNDSPLLSNVESTLLSYEENSQPLQITDSIELSDPDNLFLTDAAVQIVDNYIVGEDFLMFADQNGIIGNWDELAGKLNLIGAASLSNYQTALRSVKYFNNSDNPNTTSRTISFTVNDGKDYSNTVTRTVKIISVNDSPVLSNIEVEELIYTENDSLIQITDSIKISDVDNQTMSHAEVQIAEGYRAGEDTLSCLATNEIMANWDELNGKLILSGVSAIENYISVLRSVRYYNKSQNPSVTERKINFMVNDGETNSNLLGRKLTVVSVNNPPELTDIEDEEINYYENDFPVQLTKSLRVKDADNENIVGAVVQISRNYTEGEDFLYFNQEDEIKGTWDSKNGSLILSGISNTTNYENALRSVSYYNSSDNPSTKQREVSFQVDDGISGNLSVQKNQFGTNKKLQSFGNKLVRRINIIVVNDSPELRGIEKSVKEINEGEELNISDSIKIIDRDDSTLAKAEIWIAGGTYAKGEDKLISNFGVWDSLSGKLVIEKELSVKEYKDVLRTVKYSNTNKFHKKVTERAIKFKVYDYQSNSEEGMRVVRVGLVNHSPELRDLETSILRYNLLGDAVGITDSITIEDYDDEEITSAAVQISINYDSKSDTLLFDDFSNIKGIYYKDLGRLTLFGKDTKENYQTALRSVKFYLKNKNMPSSLRRAVQFIVGDGKASSKILQREVEIILPTDTPSISNLPDSFSIKQNESIKLNLWEYVEDRTTPDSLLDFSFKEKTGKINYSFDKANGNLEIKPKENNYGKAEIQITITNKYGASAKTSIFIEIIDEPLSVDNQRSEIPKEFILYQNYPNPFNPATKISYGLPVDSYVKVTAYNLLGEEVVVLVNRLENAGYHSVTFNAANLSSGVYLVRIQAEGLSGSKRWQYNGARKMILLR